MSMCRLLSSGTRLRSSSSSWWIALRPITPRTSPPRVAQHDPLADELDRVPAADLAEAQEALVIDVGDVDADLVDVADDRELGRFCWAVGGPDPARRRAPTRSR